MLILTAMIWGAAFVAQDVGMDHVGPFTFNAARMILGSITLIPVILITDCLAAKKTTANRPRLFAFSKTELIGGMLCGTALFAGASFQQVGISLYTDADAAAGKAARIAISGAVPVVGGILSDAADAVLLSASALGAGAGVWGILTVIALFCAPAVKIGCQYLMLKLTSAIAESLGGGRCGMLIGDFAGAMGLLLALVSTQAVLLLVSSLCFLKGVAG